MSSTPHDALFRRVFGDVHHAAGLVREMIPASVAAVVDWDEMTAVPGSFVDPDLSSKYTDLLFSVRLRDGPRALVYILVEHQSTSDPHMALRMLGYVPMGLLARLEHWLDMFAVALSAPNGAEAFGVLVRYAYAVLEKERFARFRVKMNKLPELEVHMVTMAEHLRREGRAEGTRQLLILQLEAKFPGGVSDEHRKRVDQSSDEELKEFARRLVIGVDGIDDVFG